MPGLRYDYSSLYGSFVTPRMHVKYSPTGILTLRASAGKGYRSPHALAVPHLLPAPGAGDEGIPPFQHLYRRRESHQLPPAKSDNLCCQSLVTGV